MTNGTDGIPTTERTTARRVILVSCTTHGGTPGFTNLVVTKRDGAIELDPHATGCCVLRFGEQAAGELQETIGAMLG
ncbi:MAG: hypothetical protein ACRDQU_14770 [Pseudonocardiaceae bacterium]